MEKFTVDQMKGWDKGYLIMDILSLYEEVERLEKALDKACGELNSWVNDSYTPEQWKAWCMKDES